MSAAIKYTILISLFIPTFLKCIIVHGYMLIPSDTEKKKKMNEKCMHYVGECKDDENVTLCMII